MHMTAKTFAAAIIFSAIAAASAHAGPAAAGMSNLKHSLKSSASQDQIVHKVGKKKDKIIAGLIAGVGAAVIIGASIRHERQCHRWQKRCWNGSDNACYKYDTRC